MSMVKLDYGAEVRKLERYMPRGHYGEYYEVDCPFCETNQLVQTRKFHQGVRCQKPDCRAMLRAGLWDATRDLMPKELTVMRHGMRTRCDLDESQDWSGGEGVNLGAILAKGGM